MSTRHPWNVAFWWLGTDTWHDDPDWSCRKPSSLFISLAHTWPWPVWVHELRWQTRKSIAFRFSFPFFLPQEGRVNSIWDWIIVIYYLVAVS